MLPAVSEAAAHLLSPDHGWRHQLAGTAPGGPEVNQHGQVSLQKFGGSVWPLTGVVDTVGSNKNARRCPLKHTARSWKELKSNSSGTVVEGASGCTLPCVARAPTLAGNCPAARKREHQHVSSGCHLQCPSAPLTFSTSCSKVASLTSSTARTQVWNRRASKRLLLRCGRRKAAAGRGRAAGCAAPSLAVALLLLCAQNARLMVSWTAIGGKRLGRVTAAD